MFIDVRLSRVTMWKTVYLKTACEACSGHIEYPSELAGQSVECPHCHQATPLPPPMSEGEEIATKVKEHTHERLRDMESPTGVPDSPPKESFEQVRSRINTAFREDVRNFVASPKFRSLGQTRKLQSLADMDRALRASMARGNFGTAIAQVLEQDITNVINEFREPILKER